MGTDSGINSDKEGLLNSTLPMAKSLGAKNQRALSFLLPTAPRSDLGSCTVEAEKLLLCLVAAGGWRHTFPVHHSTTSGRHLRAR